MLTAIFRFFIIWYICGVFLLSFDLLPPWLEWANSVFLITAGVIGGIYFTQLYGWLRGILYSFIVMAVSIYVEHLGVQSGFLFGDYSYGENFGLKIVDTPVTIGFAWLLVIGCSHELARGITRRFDFFPRTVLFVLTGSLIAVTMDLILDPVAYKVQQYWIWDEPGVYYDIPLSNFFGWFVLSLLFHLISLVLFNRDTTLISKLWYGRMAFIYGAIIFMFGLLAVIGGVGGAALLVVVLSFIWYGLYFWGGRHDKSEEK
ncbi:carotenoid biosynthesis protein [Halobacillus sp. Marseille-Q1614]|uniref:carotenoid biosynthesis protein n=1 Tax=Halobacillus sp. Marseille-Q1614 TaxID=2709134 RepID=UPI00156DFF77|nr:carotenoid biosynthesis protein [Halobacillus sp. Marseille-Q1614]